QKSSFTSLWLKHILNSALESDHPAKFTYLSGSRMSAIDYIIVSRDLLLYAKAPEVMSKFVNHLLSPQSALTSDESPDVLLNNYNTLTQELHQHLTHIN
ncbi:hypothetical protein L345_08470, partial [Ophiophagus hannah]